MCGNDIKKIKDNKGYKIQTKQSGIRIETEVKIDFQKW